MKLFINYVVNISCIYVCYLCNENSKNVIINKDAHSYYLLLIDYQFVWLIFLKVDLDFRYFHKFTPGQTIAFRTFIGLGYPYNNSKLMPFNEKIMPFSAA